MKEYWKTAVDYWQRSGWSKIAIPVGFLIGWPLALAFQLALVGMTFSLLVAWFDLWREINDRER